MSEQRSITTSRLGRMAHVTTLGAKLGARLTATAGLVASGLAKEKAAPAFHRAVAETLKHELARMKGLPMKAGQLLSFGAYLLPREHRAIYEAALADLRVGASPLRWKELERTLVAALGAGWESRFASFDRAPLAAASIGQVYRARLHDGRAVAVKVQYPGIADAIRSDLSNIDLVRRKLELFLPAVHVEQVLADLEARLLEETDYGCELCSQQELAAGWAGDEDIWIPRPVEELSSERVLVMELAEGRGWEALPALGAERRARAGRALFRFTFRSFYALAMTHADPHPGNYVFLDDGRLAVLDFGCVQRFDRAVVRRTAELRRAMVAGARGADMHALVREVWGAPPELVDDEGWEAVQASLVHSFRPLLTPGFRFTPEYVEEAADLGLRAGLVFARKSIRKGIRTPTTPGALFLGRTLNGLWALLAALEASGDWAALMAPIDAELDART
jgi:predicted unusual protein kinase regulating ubiquinone biosynthesis (AarF/ABC1/UbiB family)